MPTWLLTWNPQRWQWDTLAESVGVVEIEGELRDRWSCGNTRRIRDGERFFLMRQGRGVRGLIGSGHTERSSYTDDHWDGHGGKTHYVDVVFDVLREAPVVPAAELSRPGVLACSAWRTQASGVRIPDAVAVHLETIWRARTRVSGTLLPTEEGVRPESVPEGALRRVFVDAFERNPEARRLCLHHHGYTCTVCGVLLEDIYGPVAHKFIQVHHLRPLAEVRQEHVVDPVKDLRPICPNCHAIVHRRKPPLGMAEARELLRERKASN